MNWALAGQIAVVWIIVAVLAAPFIGRIMKRRKVEKQPKYAMPVQVVRDGKPIKFSDRANESLKEALIREQQDFNTRRATSMEEDEPFHLDGPVHPHPRKPAA